MGVFITSGMNRALGQMQPLSPDKLVLLGWNGNLDKQDLLLLKVKLAAHKAHHDWFFPHPEVLAEIRRILKQPDYKVSSVVCLEDLNAS